MKQQKWFCENCKAKGSVETTDAEALMEVFYKLDDDHRRASPQCPTSARHLRVINEEFRPGEYREVPISAAQTIAENFDKQEVIILAIDREHQKVHITTYGTGEPYKSNAEVTGDFLAEVLEVKKPSLYIELIERCKKIWQEARAKPK